MSLIHHIQTGSTTTSGGSATVSLTCMHSQIALVYIEPATASTVYDIKLTDTYNVDVYHRKNNTNILRDFNRPVPVYNNMTLTIENSDADEAFTYLLVFRES